MGSAEWALVWVGVITLLASIFGLWVNSKQREMDKMDSAQAKQIADLQALIKHHYEIHNIDVEKLNALELKLAESYHKKPEIDCKISEIKDTLRECFGDMGNKFDALSRALMQHINYEERRKTPRDDQ